MYKEKILIDDLKCFAKYAIEYLEETKTEEINEFDDGYKTALKQVLEIIKKYEKKANNDKR